MAILSVHNNAFAEPLSETTQNLTDEDLTIRLDYIQSALDKGAVTAKRWQYSWLIFHSTNAYINLGILLTADEPEDHDVRFDSGVNLFFASLAATRVWFAPIPAKTAGESLRKIPVKTPYERRQALYTGETYLKGCALVEQGWRSWKPHAMAGLLNAAGGMTIAYGDDRKKDGFIWFLTSTLIAEISLFTAPNRAIDDWDDYNRKFNPSSPPRHNDASWMNHISLFAYYRGLGVHYQF